MCQKTTPCCERDELLLYTCIAIAALNHPMSAVASRSRNLVIQPACPAARRRVVHGCMGVRVYEQCTPLRLPASATAAYWRIADSQRINNLTVCDSHPSAKAIYRTPQ